ncbi:ribosome hibernation factor-recruiting GTPase MRF [Pseudonocardia oceani]|uniref:GTP-binding protein n=3 Tax=Pseudonocardia oceani TaxID=2792013 RepID=A0ABS6U725_9PSEU|nr:GTP-binding protein [Pseudonocardia oceani]MBW0111161.1 GTP-binding protein [Pseudonocardia oceani]MBW0124931.1 GTP-binding protein [Pseudonocardia oceani]MBW0128035.1 GTP-binding protein [Pseudonocardia oceani]
MSRPELLVLTGLNAPGVEDVVTRVRALDPDAAVLHHDLRDVDAGLVRRRLRTRHADVTTTVELAHGCVSCTLREDLLPQLRTLAAPGGPARIVLHLDPMLEPEQVCWSLLHVLVDGTTVADEVDLRGVVAVVDAGTWLADATGDATLPERGCAGPGADDERTVAQVVVGQAEFADLVVLTGTADAWERARLDAVLARLAPDAPRLPLREVDERVLLRDAVRRGRPADVHAALLRGSPPLDADCGVRLVVFSARPPFHPGRLHDALDVLLDGVVRARGRIWLATRPDAVLWLESAGGGLRVGHAGDWLDGAGEEAWEAASAERRAIASLGWHPRFGDRAQDVVVLAHAADPDAIDAALRGALLTDAELAAGPGAWSALPDPFGWWHTDPCSPAADAVAGADAHSEEEH